jgi:dihydroorotase
VSLLLCSIFSNIFMQILKNVQVIKSWQEPLDCDICIENGIITAMQPNLTVPKNAEVKEMNGAWVMSGWLDLGVYACDPGYEHREDLHSAMRAAKAGGFASIAVMPDNQPVTDSKSQIKYILDQSKGGGVEVLPIGALSVGLEGKDMAELMDMSEAGAVAFSDGVTGTQDAGLVKRVLEYCTAFGGIVFNRPHHKSISGSGQMHESLTSTSLGMKGLPNLAETLMVQRDLSILAYTGGRLHLHLISCAESIELIRAAKAKGLQVTCSVSIAHLCYTDEMLSQFDSNLKILPPLRSETDRLAFIAAVKDGTIDCICSDHTPWHIEAKDLEFPYADFGMTGLETAFSICRMHLDKSLTVNELQRAWSDGPRRVLGLPAIEVEVGTPASSLSFFSPDAIWRYDHSTMQSRSINHVLFGEELKGRAIRI